MLAPYPTALCGHYTQKKCGCRAKNLRNVSPRVTSRCKAFEGAGALAARSYRPSRRRSAGGLAPCRRSTTHGRNEYEGGRRAERSRASVVDREGAAGGQRLRSHQVLRTHSQWRARGHESGQGGAGEPNLLRGMDASAAVPRRSGGRVSRSWASKPGLYDLAEFFVIGRERR